jgi:hypothetical protein
MNLDWFEIDVTNSCVNRMLQYIYPIPPILVRPGLRVCRFLQRTIFARGQFVIRAVIQKHFQ